MNKYYAVILAGGRGSRFWPQSRTLEPKQFLSLHKNKSLFEQTLLRIKPLIPPGNTFIVTCELYRHQIYELIKPFNIPRDNLIFEPEGKNTAPSIGLAVHLIHCKDPSAHICVLPCDHLIKYSRQFLKFLRYAFKLCKSHLIIFGIPPHRPAIGYGYIKADNCSTQAKTNVYKVKKFCEKPDFKTAQRFLKDKSYFWNSGIFVGASQIFLEEFKTYLPAFYKQLIKIEELPDIATIWKKIKPISFDYGVLEKSKRLLMVVTSGLGWSDLGSWQAWNEVLKKDKHGNLLKADVINLNSKNITVVGNNRLIATIGLEGLIIVDTADALLIAKNNKTEEVKKIVDILKAKKRKEHYAHKIVKRPWGSYSVLETGNGFKVKLVEVKPQHSLSLQFHRKRSEHWVVVEGRAKIVKDKRSCILDANESIYVPVGCVHRLLNPTDKLLKIIEVQSGNYLEEEDIVRLKDSFGRF